MFYWWKTSSPEQTSIQRANFKAAVVLRNVCWSNATWNRCLTCVSLWNRRRSGISCLLLYRFLSPVSLLRPSAMPEAKLWCWEWEEGCHQVNLMAPPVTDVFQLQSPFRITEPGPRPVPGEFSLLLMTPLICRGGGWCGRWVNDASTHLTEQSH